MKRISKYVVVGILLLVVMISICGCGKKSLLDAKNPITIHVWNYYSGYQQITFDEMVAEFNETEGLEKGIIVSSVGMGSINGLEDELDKAIRGEGVTELPNIVTIYADSVYRLNMDEILVSLDDYYTKEEQDIFIPSFLEEGRLKEGGDLKLIPICKTTEVMLYNKTDFDLFAKETGAKPEDMLTMESLAKTAERYYEWSDSKTPEIPEDGKAFYGRDSMENYMVSGSAQLGHPVFGVNADGVGQCMLDRDTIYTLWSNYYIPYINGYYAAFGQFRSEDAKIGKIIASVGSASGVSYFPTSVTVEDDTTYEIEVGIQEAPVFQNGNGMTMQQGAGYGVLKSEEAKQYASVEFLKWMTQTDKNMEFSIGANYFPATKNGMDENNINSYLEKNAEIEERKLLKESLLITKKLVEEDRLWTLKHFVQSGDLRAYLGQSIRNKAQEDRDAVILKIQEGKTREEAVASYITEEYFESWYLEITEGTNEIMSGTINN